MRLFHVFAALAAGMTALAPVADAQIQYFVTDVYLTASPGPPWQLEGYSYIGYPYGSGPYPIATEAQLSPGALADSFCSTDGVGDYGWCTYGMGDVYANVEVSVSQPGDYLLTGLYFWDQWLAEDWEQIGEAYYDVEVEDTPEIATVSGGCTDSPSDQSCASPWQQGATVYFTVSGSGFGSCPQVSVSGSDSTNVSWSSDSAIDGTVAVDSNASELDFSVSQGSCGQGFYGGGASSNDCEVNTSPGPGACADPNLSAIVQQYVTYNVGWVPDCSSFTQSAQSQYFGPSELMGGNTWAIIRQPLTISTSSGYGLDLWRQSYGGPRSPTSVYRTPSHNASIGGAPHSRHMFGDAVDLANASGTITEWQNMVNAASAASADYIEPQSGPCGLSCTHADWRNH